VVCKTGDVESRLAVEVKKYVLPKFKATVTTDKPFYKPGETIKLTVQADYFFGKPVTESAVDVEVLNDAAGQAPTRLTGRTDGKGAVSFDYAVPPDANRQASAVSRIHFQVAVVDPAGQKQTASADAPVSESPAQIQVIPEAGELVQGPNTIYVLVTRLDGTPAQHAHLALFDLNKPHAEDKPSIPELADADEDGAAAFSIAPIPEPTHFGWQASLKVVAHDDLGMEIADCLANVRCGSTDDFLVRTDKAVYKAGDTMTLTAVGGHSGAVFVDLIKDGQTLRTETIEMANGQGQAAVDLAPDLAGTLQIVAYRLDKDGKPKRKARIVYVRPADDIHIAATLDPAKKEYRPGDSTQLHLQLTDKSGNPCPGAVSLAGVDEAVFSMLPQRPGTETAFYTLNEDLMAPVNRIHPWSPDVNASQRYEQALFAAASSVDETVQDHRNVPVLIDKKTMAPVDATHSLVAQTYEAKVQETAALRADRLRLMPQLWVAFIAAVIVTGFLGFWLFSQASILNKSVASVSILLPCTFYALIALQFTGQMGGKTQKDRINLVSGRQIFRDTNGVMPMEGAFGEVSMNQGFARVVDIKTLLDPARPQQGAPSPPRIRELFPETLLWRPEIVTDDEGHAALPLELADSITTWRLSASAVAADGKLGAAQLPVKVFRDFFVDLNLPVALTRGDEVGVPIVVYNYLDKPQTVALTLADDHDGWFTRLDGAEQRLDLGPNEVRSVHYRLKVEKVGDWTLTVAARGAADSDAVKRPIEVLPDGRRVEEVVNGVLEKPADVSLTVPENCIPGSAKEFVKIYPSTFSQVMEGLDGVFRMPNGCFEQTSSMTYPNVLALDYLQRTGQNRPAVRAKAEGYIRSGYQRLVGFEVLDDRGRPSGGFDWFGHAPANRALTAYGLMEFTDMARVQDVDPKLIARTRSWLLAQRQVDGSWDPETHRMHDDAVGGDPADARPAETAYVAWAVFGDRAAASDAFVTLNYLKSRISESIHDPHVLALVCNALLTVDAHNADAIPYLNRLESLKKFSDDGKFAWWEQPAGARTTFYGAGRGGEVETTALATLALIR
ncbi:MAG TPA: alpha-2-macroglobulin family protein, partial [Gemmataceae bacterium]|nr:alpha-2-macroglobulin family protein [Gemmataceae bacterium]